MKVVITGGAGFLGRKLAAEVLRRGRLMNAAGQPETVEELVLFDAVEPASPIPGDNRVSLQTGDIADRDLVARIIGPDTQSIFHLASVVSAGAEEDFDLGYRTNLEGMLAVLEAARATAHRTRLVFASSLASFGGEYREVDDATPQTPQTSYGTQKAIGELLANDYSRKGFIQSRSVRLPTIAIRPGRPNKAASTWVSSIIREPLQGEEAICPVTRDARMVVLSPRRAVASLADLHDLPDDALGPWRSLNFPGITVTVAEMVAALRAVGGEEAADRIRWEPDPAVQKIVAGWPSAFGWDKARALGFTADPSMEAIVRAFVEDDMVRRDP